jgi:DNA polymerase III delta subunit
MSSTGFELVNALSDGHTGKALGILDSLLDEGKFFSEILGILAWHFRRLKSAKEMLAEIPDHRMRDVNIQNPKKKAEAEKVWEGLDERIQIIRGFSKERSPA